VSEQQDKILVVDDDARLRSLLQRFLEEAGYTVKAVGDAEQMDRALSRELYSLMVLDLMLPGEDGLSICRRLREAENVMPIMPSALKAWMPAPMTTCPSRSTPRNWMPVSARCCAAMCASCPGRPARKKGR